MLLSLHHVVIQMEPMWLLSRDHPGYSHASEGFGAPSRNPKSELLSPLYYCSLDSAEVVSPRLNASSDNASHIGTLLCMCPFSAPQVQERFCHVHPPEPSSLER